MADQILDQPLKREEKARKEWGKVIEVSENHSIIINKGELLKTKKK